MTFDSLIRDEERFRALVTATSDVVYRMSPDWSELRQLIGREFIEDTTDPSRSWLEKYIHPDDQAAVSAAVALAIKAKGRFELEHRVIRADGTLGWTYSRAVPLFDAHGEIVEWIGAASDVTERRQAAEALTLLRTDAEQERRLFQTILDSTPDLVYVFDLNSRFIYANAALLKMWGKTRDEAIGRGLLELGYEPWHAQMHENEIAHVIATKQPIRGDVPFTGTEGRRMYDYIFVPVLDAAGEVVAIAGTTRDVTERKHAEDALRDADRRKDEFLAMLAHELRNPLAPIANAVQLLRRDKSTDSLQVQARAILDRQIGRLSRLVDDLLEVARITSGRIQLHREQISLDGLIERTVESVRSLIEQQRHTLHVALPPQSVWLHGDATRLEQVFVNLLNNAAKYTEPGGRIDIAIEQIDGHALVSVRDTGLGIEAKLLPRVFDLFTQAERSLDRSNGGLGVGLSLVRRLVEMHGGTVTAVSEVGRGSTFTVKLPALELAAPTAQPTQEPPNNITHALSVIVVDDNIDAAQSLALLLQATGHRVRIASDGPAALDAIREHAPDVVFLDIGLPTLNGYEVAKRVRGDQQYGKTQLIAMTGYGQASDRERSSGAGFDGHLVKPVEFTVVEQLLARIAKVREVNDAAATSSAHVAPSADS